MSFSTSSLSIQRHMLKADLDPEKSSTSDGDVNSTEEN